MTEANKRSNQRKFGLLTTFLVVLCLGAIYYFQLPQDSPSKYADLANWAYYQEGGEQPADVFLVCPTVDMGKNGNDNMSLDDEDTKANFLGALNMERGIYEESAVLYAPYYQQVTFPVYSLEAQDAAPYFDIAYADVKEAFRYYLENSDADRPLLLAGFSQGADMVIRLLKDFFGDESCQERLVAAYCIGWRITEDDVQTYPWLKPAQGETDVGVVVSFNSEAETITDSLLVPAGVKTYAINPLNWQTDAAPADASANKGACFTDYSGAIVTEISAFTGAYLDETRGTLKLPDIDPADYSNALFPDGVYHLYDYQFFFRNLQENVADRVAAYLQMQEAKN